MSFVKLMRERYTTKKYDPSKKISSVQINELKEILQLSPSSLNSQPWKFTFVSDKNIKEKLSKVSWLNTNVVLDSHTVVVFSRFDNIDLFEKQMTQEFSERRMDYYREYIQPQSGEQKRAWIDRQVYLALGVFLSACAEMEIDATPMEGIEPDSYDEILNQKDFAAIVAVCIGYRDKDDFNQPIKSPKTRRAIGKVIEVL